MVQNFQEHATEADVSLNPSPHNAGNVDEAAGRVSFNEYQTTDVSIRLHETDITTDPLSTTYDMSSDNETTSSLFPINEMNRNSKPDNNARDEIENLKQLVNDLDVLQEIQMNKSQYFVQTHEDSAGEIAVNETRDYVGLLESFLERFKQLQRVIDANGDESVKREYESVGFLDVETYESLLNDSKNLEYALQKLHSLRAEYKNISDQHEEIRKHDIEFSRSGNLNLLQYIVEEKRNEIDNLQTFSQSTRSLSDFIALHNLSHKFDTNKTATFLNPTPLEAGIIPNLNEEKKVQEEYMQTRIAEWKSILFLQNKVLPPLQVFVFIVGIICNGVLLIIFIRHTEMRTYPNVMLINLAFGEILSLIISIPTTYSYYYTASGKTTTAACKAYTFFRVQGIVVSAYSLVVINIQRYFAITALLDRRGILFGRAIKSLCLILLVWTIGAIVALPYTVYAGAENGYCYAGRRGKQEEVRLATTMIGFLGICVLPVILNTTFSGLSVGHLRSSAKRIPGERIGQEQLRKQRVLSSNVLVVLIIIFVICYTPYYFFNFVYYWFPIHVEEVAFQYITQFSYTLIFLHSSLNPIALYIVSKKYRRYFNKYLLCRKISHSDMSSNETLSDTTINTAV